MRSFSWVVSVCGKNLRGLWLLTASRCATALIAVAYALLMQRAIDAAVAGDAPAFWAGLAAFAAALLASVAFSALSKYLAEAVQAKIENALRDHAACAIVRAGRLPRGRASGDVASVLTSDVTAVAGAVVSIVPEAASMLVRAAAALALMFAVAPALAAFFVAAGTACVGVSLVIRRWLKRRHEKAQASEASMRSRLQEVLESLVVVRSFGAQDRAMEGLRGLMGVHLRARERRAAGKAVSGTVFNLAMQASYLAGFGYGCWGILTGKVSYGTLMALVPLVGQVRAPFASLSGLLPQSAALWASCERLRAIEPPAPALVSPAPGARFSSLRFDSVRFAYADGEKDVLSGFSAQVDAGEFVAVTGPSGAGKSTALMLALGMEEPGDGAVDVLFSDGGRVAAAKLAPGTFAYVPQGNMLMSGSVRDAVCLAAGTGTAAGAGEGTAAGEKPEDARLAAACRAACAEGFIADLPRGYDTCLGEKGAGLSEGQMQRLAVARAVYSGAPVLLLDECTSALDEATEKEMLARLRALGKTVVIVTHRPAALAICDRSLAIGA